jgi:XTP/dITP diphosphohydrolase
MIELLVATTNPGKLAELERLFAPLGVRVRSPAEVGGIPEIVEDGHTFEQNATKKAREVAVATGMMVLADDSGLEVDALDGAPGVRSARYAGSMATDAANNEKLLSALAAVPVERRTARFRCVLALADPEGPLGERLHVEHGVCEGRVGHVPRGDNGFGYDPLFELPDERRTMAELTPDEKARRSHRGRAARSMRDFLRGYLAER